MNYFELLGVERSFSLGEAALQQAYVRAQQQYHPDRMIGKSEAERHRAIQMSMDVNHAYEVLKSPRRRAEHLLALQGIRVNQDGGDAVRPSQALLMEVMQWQEAIADGEEILAQLVEEENKNLQIIKSAFESDDTEVAAQAVIRQRYLEKARQDAALALTQQSA
jgi:molecular chaperone HscB